MSKQQNHFVIFEILLVLKMMAPPPPGFWSVQIIYLSPSLSLSLSPLYCNEQTRLLLGDLSGAIDPNYSGSIAMALGCIHRRWIFSYCFIMFSPFSYLFIYFLMPLKTFVYLYGMSYNNDWFARDLELLVSHPQSLGACKNKNKTPWQNISLVLEGLTMKTWFIYI